MAGKKQARQLLQVGCVSVKGLLRLLAPLCIMWDEDGGDPRRSHVIICAVGLAYATVSN